MNNRRDFLKSSAAVAAPLLVSARCFSADAPSNRINVAFIGTGNQGMGMLKRFLAADLGNVLAVCDVNEGSYGYKEPEHFYGRNPAKEMVETDNLRRSKSGTANKCDVYSDFRQVLQREDIDAVVVVVPDHWHRTITVMALEAGKDVYCEKPLTFSVADGRQMIEATRNNNRILQTGSQERSNPVSQFICEAAKAGRIGKLTRIVTKVGYNNKVGPGPGWDAMPVPKTLDYPTWLGPAPVAPYHDDRCLYRFRFNYDYSGGQITNFGAHCNDMAHWGMGIDTGGPVEVECLDAKFLPEGSLFNTATETRFRCKYVSGVELICESGPESVQTRFEGSDGWLQTGYKGTTASNPELLVGLPNKPTGTQDPHSAHLANFIECVKTRKEPRAPVEVGHSSAVLCHIANAMIRLFPETGPGRVAKWDAANETFVGDERANEMLVRQQRDPFSGG
ncbi:Gfo/Idh/MocA family oxidoreductase [Rubripirellula reticaptiva]|uniref:Glucose--fructose oxidoreductase n=1 Tax=Rubripirellula reticaptiva TaxID=2528013 RepID=A0A5C6ECM6_9BACT|nr:Gfo/Idh/MocA family oxidoreductase [Rubripirellula reticaptiva]TWU46410.1 Glucose--fructose oxidoreductase precursor [Rubripirellula reticaptiva]